MTTKTTKTLIAGMAALALLVVLPGAQANLSTSASADASCTQRGTSTFFDASSSYSATATATIDEINWNLQASGSGTNLLAEADSDFWPLGDGNAHVGESTSWTAPAGTVIHAEAKATATSALHSVAPREAVDDATCKPAPKKVNVDCESTMETIRELISGVAVTSETSLTIIDPYTLCESIDIQAA